MEYFNAEGFMEVAGWVHRLKMYPFIDIAYYGLNTMVVKDDLASGATLFSRKHPLSCWMASMVMCFSGSILANFLCGESVLIPFKRTEDVLLATIVWYMVFYSPFDFATKVAKTQPFSLILACMKEVRRAWNVYHGVAHAAKAFPHAYIVMVIVGTAKGAASGILRTFEQLIRGVWVPAGNEILRPTFYTKACILASIVFTLEKRGGYIELPHELLYLAVVAFFVYFKLSAVLLGIQDPFLPFENLFCAIFMGGVWDAFQRAISASKERKTNLASNSVTQPSEEEKKEQ